MKKTIVIFCITILILTTNVIAVNNIWFHDNGNINWIDAENTRIDYYENGKLSFIETKLDDGSELEIDFNEDSTIHWVRTASGEIWFQDNSNNIDWIEGNITAICKDVKNGLEKALSDVSAYISSINIKVPGAATPEDSVQVVTDSFNEIIIRLNNLTDTTVSTTVTSNSDMNAISFNTVSSTTSNSVSEVSATQLAGSGLTSLNTVSTPTTPSSSLSVNSDGLTTTTGATTDDVKISATDDKLDNTKIFLILGIMFALLLVVGVLVFVVIRGKSKKTE